jgi:hypothetical protein
MIRYIEMKNCFSFFEETALRFEVNNKAPASKKYQQSLIQGERLAKVIGVVGPNGSGKSNLLRVIAFLKWFLLSSFGEKPDGEFPLRPFLLKEGPFEPARIKVEFECDANSKLYRYEVLLTGTQVISEELSGFDLAQKPEPERKKFKQLFSRVFDPEKEEYTVRSHPDFSLSEGIRDLVKKRHNASLVSAAIFSSHEQSLELKNYWSKVETRIKQFGERSFPIDYHVFESTEFYYKNEDFRLSMEEIMAKCDLGLVGLDIEKIELPQATTPGKQQEFFMPYGKHSGVGGKIYRLPFPWESGGTHQIYVLLSTLLPVLKSGGLAVIDEMEADLHPELLPALVDLFVSPKTNPKAAQLIFTCHATPLLNILDKYQIVIVEKNGEGISEAWRLDEIEGVRNDDNFYAKYSAGSYGGVPQLGKLSDVAERLK